MGAWIETPAGCSSGAASAVAPYMGAWIETASMPGYGPIHTSLPIWERGLKRLIQGDILQLISRSLYGSVD